MIERKVDKNKKGSLPAFTPVPRQCERFDGWTPERQRGFIEALAELGSVKAAAHAVNMAPEGAYMLRRHPEGGEFRKAWEAALQCGVQRLEDVAMERALHGVEVPVYSYGKLIGTRRVHNDRLLMFLLRNRAGKRFADGGLNLSDRSTLVRLKRQWHKEWKREQYEVSREQSRQARAGFEEKVARWQEERSLQIARSLRAEWLRLGGPPTLPDDEDEDWEAGDGEDLEDEE